MILQHILVLFGLFQGMFGTIHICKENNACSDIDSYRFASIWSTCYYNPDVLSDIMSMINRHGYNAKTYSVTTDDGYILQMYRVSNKTSNTGKDPVCLLHGLAATADNWVARGNRSLAFNLVDKGYDVWIATYRGSEIVNSHENMTVLDPEYWNFNLDTLTDNDVRIQLNFVGNMTKKKIIIIGHSMGTTLSFMYASAYRKEADNLIKGIIALAPVAYVDTIMAPSGVPLLLNLLEVLNIKNVPLKGGVVQQTLMINTCKLFPQTCYSMITKGNTAYRPSQQFAPDDMLLFLSYNPAGQSIYQLKQYVQFAESSRFQKYDYGKDGNKEKYDTLLPPLYNLANIQIPVCLFYGKNDFSYNEKNLERLYNKLNSTRKCKFPVPLNGTDENDFSHTDFIYSKYIVEYLYENVFKVLESYVNNN